MKNIYLWLIVLAVLSACRKDNSTFLNSAAKASNQTGDKCLIVLASNLQSGLKGTTNYQLDSVFESTIYSQGGLENQYLIKENSSTFLFALGSKELKDVKYRVYLNSFGAVQKEVNVILNADKKTFTEVTSEANIYTYNDKKQVVKMLRGLDPDDISFFEFIYDQQNRINKIQVYDKENGRIYFTYDNFKFSTQKKKDNLFQIGADNSVGFFFIPSLRNAYITHYETNFEGLGMPPDTYDFDFKFNNGNLSSIKFKYLVFGITVENEISYTVNCK